MIRRLRHRPLYYGLAPQIAGLRRGIAEADEVMTFGAKLKTTVHQLRLVGFIQETRNNFFAPA